MVVLIYTSKSIGKRGVNESVVGERMELMYLDRISKDLNSKEVIFQCLGFIEEVMQSRILQFSERFKRPPTGM